MFVGQLVEQFNGINYVHVLDRLRAFSHESGGLGQHGTRHDTLSCAWVGGVSIKSTIRMSQVILFILW